MAILFITQAAGSVVNSSLVLEEIFQIYKSLTLNCHKTQFRWQQTQEWSCFGRVWMLIHWCTKSTFLLSQTDNERLTPLWYQELHSSFTNIPSFSPKWNAVWAKMPPRWRVSKVSGSRTYFQLSKISLWELYDVHLKKTFSTDSLQAPQLGHSLTHPPYHAHPTPRTAHG